MKKLSVLLIALFIMGLSSIASADEHDGRHYDHHHDWSHPSYQDRSWSRTERVDEPMPFKWHERHDWFSSHNYHMTRIYDREWNDRFPGLHSYRWHDERGDGFLYHGHRITDAVLFYDDLNQLVSIGFKHNGTFIFIRDDHISYENHDSFFISWWDHN
jgi:hypothetical protein